MSDRIFTESELRRFDGKRGRRMYVACDGIVYDVTVGPKWRTGLHEGQPFPSLNLTSEFPEAPHKHEVFNRPCLKKVGLLQN